MAQLYSVSADSTGGFDDDAASENSGEEIIRDSTREVEAVFD